MTKAETGTPGQKRTHDEFYLQVDRKGTPKEYFKFIAKYICDSGINLANKRILDIGCATGDFLFFMGTQFPECQLHGIEIMPQLANRARDSVKNSVIEVADITSRTFLHKQNYDCIFMLGVHSIFDDLEWLENVNKLLARDGNFFCFGLFNPFEIDVFVKAKRKDGSLLEPGWNVFSVATMTEKLLSLSMEARFTPWSIGIPIAPNPNDPFRSWTVPLKDGSLEVRNGLQINHTFYLLHSRHK